MEGKPGVGNEHVLSGGTCFPMVRGHVPLKTGGAVYLIPCLRWFFGLDYCSRFCCEQLAVDMNHIGGCRSEEAE